MPNANQASSDGDRDGAVSDRANWAAVIGLALCSFVVNASEFMPVGLISPIASTLNLTEGETGQANAVSGISAVTTSLLLSQIVGSWDRRRVLLALIGLLLIANVVIALATAHYTLMFGRALLGIVVGGFWSMSAAIAMRLVPADKVPTALAIVNCGGALAFALVGPLGSYVGGVIGWRGTFFSMVPLVALVGLWQLFALQALKVDEHRSAGTVLALLKDRVLIVGMLAVGLFYTGYFSLFTYLRPFLEQVTGLQGSELSIMLLVVGASGFTGAMVIGRLLDDKHLYLILAALSAVLGAVAAGLAMLGSSTVATAILLAIWGFAGTAAPAVWWTWLARSVPRAAEAGGGLLVAVMQAAIALGAAGGGFLFDTFGPQTQFICSAVLLAVTVVAVGWLARLRSRVAVR